MAKSKRKKDDSSAVSTVSIGSEMCKICHCNGSGADLIAPCYCSGSLKYVHQECLQRWIKSSDIKRCELCKYPFAMQAKVKPFCQWEKLDMTALERRKLFCSVTFHVVAITCVVWSLYVLIDRTAEEIRNGELQWPFWTKLVVVAIGFTGGLVFMYIQCKVYVHLCRKWKAYNRTIVVQDAPEGVHKPSDRQISTSKSMAPSTSSRRSSSAPSATTTSAPPPPPTLPSTEKTNAETQTALRGVAILENDCGHAHTAGFGHAHFSGSSPRVHQEPLFFTECECNLKSSNKVTTPNLNERGRGPKHSTSTPNVHQSNSKIRKFSLSPVRSTKQLLPGSPDFAEPVNQPGKTTETVLSPVKKPA